MYLHQLSILVALVAVGEAAIKNYSIGGGIQPGGNNNGGYNTPTYGGGSNNGIGNGVSPNNGGQSNPGFGTGSLNEGDVCVNTSQCRSGLYCTVVVNGKAICLSPSNGGGTNGGNTGGNGGCQTSANCQSGTICVVRNGVGSCQIQAGGYIQPSARNDYDTNRMNRVRPEIGKLNSECEKDGDCDDELACTLYFGEMMCRQPIKPLIPLRCETGSDCPSEDYLCVFSTALQDKTCYKYGDTVTDGYVIPIKHKIALELKTSTTTTLPTTTTSMPTEMFAESSAIFQEGEEQKTVISRSTEKKEQEKPTPPVYMKMEDTMVMANSDERELVKETKVVVREETPSVENEPIDPAATLCEYDYHCRMGESCSGLVRFVDHNITVCRYDILKKHRQCIYHSDCLSGQRCIPKTKDLATCEADISATLGTIACFYDYQCSGGEKCVTNDTKDGAKFICRPPPTTDPRSGQLCSSNAECPFQQVCRRSAGISLCVDISISRNPSLLQERLIRLFRNLMFRSV